MRLTDIVHAAGHWLVLKARQQQLRMGTQPAARNLRKQGVPLSLALAILAPRRPRPASRDVQDRNAGC